MQRRTADHREALDFEAEEEDYLMDEEGAPDSKASPPPATTFLTLDRASLGRKTKGRGFHQDSAFSLTAEAGGRGHAVPERSIEGWIILLTGVHKDAKEDDLKDVFGDHGMIKNIKLILDHARCGEVKGALIEYEHYEEAMKAIEKSNGSEFLTQTIYVDWAFITGPVNVSMKRKNGRSHQKRSRSPLMRY